MNYAKASIKSRTKNNNAALISSRKMINDISENVLTPVIEGKKCLHTAIQDSGYDYTEVSRILADSRGERPIKTTSPTERLEEYYSGVERFYASVFGIGLGTYDMSELDIPIEAEANLNWVLENSAALTSRESQALRLYFVDELTLDEIGSELTLTRERVRQIINRSLRKLRSTTRRKERLVLQFGVGAYDEYVQRKDDLRNAMINNYILKDHPELRDFVTALNNELPTEPKRKTIEEIKLMPLHDVIPTFNRKTNKWTHPEDCPEFWNLSVRSFNCVVRGFGYPGHTNLYNSMFREYGVNPDTITVQEFANLDTSVLIACLRNCGKKSAEEIIDAFSPYR